MDPEPAQNAHACGAWCPPSGSLPVSQALALLVVVLASPSPECTSVQQDPPEEGQEQETKVAVRGDPGQGTCGEAECDSADG